MNRNRNARQSFKGNGGRASCVTRCNVTVTLAGTVSLVAFTLHNRGELRAAAGVEHVFVRAALPDDRAGAGRDRDDVALADIVDTVGRLALAVEGDGVGLDGRDAVRHLHVRAGLAHRPVGRLDGGAEVSVYGLEPPEERVNVFPDFAVDPDIDPLDDAVTTEDEGVPGGGVGAEHDTG